MSKRKKLVVTIILAGLLWTLILLLLYRSCEVQAEAVEVPILPEVAIPEPLPQKVSGGGALVSAHALRVAKCELIVRELYPNSGFLPYVEYFVSTFEKYGMGEDWWWGLCYSGAGIGLRCHYRARNGCAGPTDIPGGSTNPKANISAHCKEWFGFYKRGIEGYAAAKCVFFPRRPHDWLPGKSIGHMHRTQKRGRIWQAHLRHKQVIEEAYRQGKLP